MKQPAKREKRIAGIKQSHVTGCFIILLVIIVFLTIMFLYGYMGE